MTPVSSMQSLITHAQNKNFPMDLGNGVSVTLSSRKTVQDLFDQHAPVVFPELSARRQFALPEERKAGATLTRDSYSDTGHRDWLVAVKDGRTIGWFMGEQADHGTYYLRNSALLPEHWCAHCTVID